jgi:uncharacterized coiled-coil protein SlyX
MACYCWHIECQANYPSANWGHQRCLYVDGRLNTKSLQENRIEELTKLATRLQKYYTDESDRCNALAKELKETKDQFKNFQEMMLSDIALSI